MASTSWPSPDDDHIVTDLQYEQIAMRSTGNGVVGALDDTTVVTADGLSRAVIIRSGKYGRIDGHVWYSGTTNITVAVAANSSGSTRYDLVVLRLTRSTWNVTEEIVTGTPGAGVPPDPTQNAGTTGVWEVPLASVEVANGASVITAGNVTNLAGIITATGDLAFPTAAARDLAIQDPAEGDSAYIADLKCRTVHDGTAWGEFARQRASPVKTADQTMTSTTAIDDSVLYIPVAAAGTWALDWWLLYSVPSSDDMRIYLTWPADGTCPWGVTGLDSGLGANSVGFDAPTSGTSYFVIGGNGDSNTMTCHVSATYTAGGTAGNVRLQFGLHSGSGTARMRKGSRLTAVRLA